VKDGDRGREGGGVRGAACDVGRCWGGREVMLW